MQVSIFVRRQVSCVFRYARATSDFAQRDVNSGFVERKGICARSERARGRGPVFALISCTALESQQPPCALVRAQVRECLWMSVCVCVYVWTDKFDKFRSGAERGRAH